MQRRELATRFIQALDRQVDRKAFLYDGVHAPQKDALRLLASIAEELGEVATDLARERRFGAIAECVDVAHSALLLAIALDCDGVVLNRLFSGE